MTASFHAGAAVSDITPLDSQFLYGYPHVPRYSTGVHDPLLASALYLTDGRTQAIFIANDIIFVTKAIAQRARRRIAESTGIPAGNIMITATHTHSGPITVKYLSNQSDPVVPEPDPAYLQRLEDGIVAAARQAVAAAVPAEAGLVIADGSMVGTNRRDPAGPRDAQVPVLLVRRTDGGGHIAAMLVCCMHPTVLHEDSTLVSGDFPGLARRYLQSEVFGDGCVVLHHSGPCGNQSPRHVTKGNTFAEAERLGRSLGASIEHAVVNAQYSKALGIECRAREVQLPWREFPAPQAAQVRLKEAVQRLESLRAGSAPRADIRTAECDWFGAEETLTLARAAADGKLQQAAATCMPAEVQLIRVGPWSFVGWPGEAFVEFGIDVKRQCPDTFVITLANGELQGYLVTAEAAAEAGYEASNALFASPESGGRVRDAAIELMRSVT